MYIDSLVTLLRGLLPGGWSVDEAAAERPSASGRAVPVIAITGPDAVTALIAVDIRPRLSAREAAAVGPALVRRSEAVGATEAMVYTRFASRMARDRLKDAGVSYVDETGNVRVSLRRPAVYIERHGAETDPSPLRRAPRSLKGAKAGRLVRALCDWRPPLGVRELARRTDTNAGHVARVLAFLEEEDVVVRDGRGGVEEVRWQELLRRRSRDYSVFGTNRAVRYVAPSGITDVMRRLESYPGRYALTGSFAVPSVAGVAHGRLLSCYVPLAEEAARELGLHEAEAGANVLLIEPFDAYVFQLTREVEGRTAVALTQCVLDLLTGSRRSPSPGELLLSWMAEHETDWRS
jgi:hypothetical protein